MKRIVSLGITILFICSSFYPFDHAVLKSNPDNEIKNGDIIFHTSLSSQSKAIQLATKSTFSHCGIIFKEGNQFFMYLRQYNLLKKRH